MDANSDARLNTSNINRPFAAGIIIFFITTLTLFSCVPEPLELDEIKAAPPQIAVSSWVMADSTIVIMLTKTIGALEANSKSNPQELMPQIVINDAKVTITTAGKTYPFESIQNGMYEGVDIPLKAGSEYHLAVVSKSMGEVTASTVAQQAVRFDKVTADKTTLDGYEFLTSVEYAITDPPARNYYIINFQNARKQDVLANLIRPDAYTRLLVDTAFNGKQFYDSFVAATSGRQSDSVAISLANVGKEYFDYVKLKMENDLELVEVFSEPIHYPTNIRGGRGFFTLHLPDVWLMDLR